MNDGEMAAGPFGTLTRYFFTSFFRLSFLDDAGEESFKRAVVWLLSTVIAFGLLLTRLYIGRYTGISDPALLAHTLAADRLFLITMPMLVSMFVMALSSHAVFPDEVDFRTLMALPLSRATVFTAKFSALLLFAAIFAAGSAIGLVLPISLMANAHDTRPPIATVLQVVVGVCSSGFAVALIVGLEGLITVLLPRSVLRRASVAIQTTLVAVLVLSLPVVLRIPGMEAAIARRTALLHVLPPAWLLGIEEWLLGHRTAEVARLAAIGVVGFALVLLIAVGCSLVIYRRFDQSVLRPDSGRAPWAWNIPVRLPFARPAAAEAVRDFMAATIRRSGLHQLVFAAICAAGVGLATNALLGAMGRSDIWIVRASLRVPFTIMAAAILGLRLSLRLPTNLRAGWVFRITETAANRGHQLDAVRHALFSAGVVLPVLFVFPMHAAILGVRESVTLVPVMVLIGWTFTEGTCLDWRRIPFTCTFLFAKRPAPFLVITLLLIFGWFVVISGALLAVASTGLVPWLIVVGCIGTLGLGLRLLRLQQWGRWPLEFEDYVPDGIDTLRLGG
jgi:hypothetical protein